MGDTININTVNGDAVVAKDQAVININKQISEAANITGSLEDKLKELSDIVHKMIKDLPHDKAEDVTENFEILVNQAQKKKPQKALCEVSATGLIEAAKAVGATAQQVIPVIQDVMKLLVP